PAFLRRQAD
ncbi:cell division protein FtsZ, partial [Vibrio parahaemolyticus VPTS-2010]